MFQTGAVRVKDWVEALPQLLLAVLWLSQLHLAREERPELLLVHRLAMAP